VDGAEVIYLDTHVLVRLYLGDVSKLSKAAKRAIEDNELVASAAAVLELQFLHEIGRLGPSASKVVSALGTEIGLTVCSLPFRTVAEVALHENWGRDPFDRLIVANAKAAGAPLLSRDDRILRHYAKAIW
jgi:PIN domain nuclease of toxin-antitoxin system